MIRKPETIAFRWGRLPHWEVVDGRYFVTLHLSGAIPEQGQERIHQRSEELHRLPADDLEGRPRISRHIFAEMEAWLDRAPQRTDLQDPAIAKMVMEAIDFQQQRDWNMFEFVVMPTHLHLFFEVLRGSLKTVMEQFKRWTGHQAGKLLDLDGGRFCRTNGSIIGRDPMRKPKEPPSTSAEIPRRQGLCPVTWIGPTAPGRPLAHASRAEVGPARRAGLRRNVGTGPARLAGPTSEDRSGCPSIH